jgi:predicted MFS family arabinose efflux permease
MTVKNQVQIVGTPAAVKNKSISVASYAWVILFVVFLASTAAPLNQFKVPPLIPVLMEAFHLSLSQAGTLMSVFAITGLILALPAGFILQKLGPKVAGLIAVGCLVIGSAWGALAESAGVLLSSRVVEGVGMGLIAVVAPASIALWFPRERQGAAMGIWGAWVPVGNVLMYSLAPALATAAGWQAVWWTGAGFALVAFILYGLFMRLPPAQDGGPRAEPGGAVGDPTPQFGKSLANRSIWLLGLQFACFNLVLIGFATFFPTFLAEERSYSLAQAGWIASLSTIAALVAVPLAGWLSDRISSRRLLIALPFLVIAGLMLLPFHLTGWTLYAFVLLLGLVSAAIPAATFAAAPEVMGNPRLAGMGLAVVALGMNLGIVIGPILLGMLVETMGWAMAGYWLAPVCLLGFVAAWMVKVR